MSTILTEKWGYTAHPAKENLNSKVVGQLNPTRLLQRVKEEVKRRLKTSTARVCPTDAAPTDPSMRWYGLESFDNSATRTA